MTLDLAAGSRTHRIACAVLAVFETGRVPNPAAYATATILDDGAGISYGVHQATDRSGALDAVISEYVADPRALFGRELAPFLSRLAPGAPTAAPQAWTSELLALLRKAGADPVMQRAQDTVFARDYWSPAVAYGQAIGLVEPLSYVVLYDTSIQSGMGRADTHRSTFAELPPSRGGSERAWVSAYLTARRRWLAGNQKPVVQKTVYRVDALALLVGSGCWALPTPFVVRGQTINEPR